MVNIVKANGKIEQFNEDKLLLSIKRAGIPQEMYEEVLAHVKQRLYENIPTHEIYYHITEFLGKKKPYLKDKYSLKRSLMDLGPTGFPFEKYVAEILKAQGYSTKVGQTLMGKCVTHEVDIEAHKGNEKIMVECKFHNRPGTRSDIQVSLYTKARFDDLKDKHGFTKALLVTNTKVTKDALSYANCEGIDVLSWEYPQGESIRDLIEKYRLYPITQLSYLTPAQVQELTKIGIVLSKQICKNPDILREILPPGKKTEEVLDEAKRLCNL